MSFILDALRKAERDRNLGQAPRMEDVALAQDRAAASAPRTGSGRRWRVALLALFVILALPATWYMRGRTAPPAAAPAPAGVITATVRGPAPVEPPPQAVAATTASVETAPPALASDAEITSLDDLSPSATPKPAASANARTDRTVVRAEDFVAQPAETAPAAASDATADRPFAAPSADEAPAPVAAPKAAVAPARPARLAVDAAADGDATPLSDMPSDYRADFPALTVEVHVWDDNPAKRFVIVNGKHYNEGQTLAEGPHLVQIAQQGLILEFRGSRVLYSLE